MPKIDLANLREEIEAEREWRDAEMRFLRNIVAGVADSDADRFRRTLVVMLYAHFEGACKGIVSIYINHINRLRLQAQDCISALAASGLESIFAGLRSPFKKSEIFRSSLPDDSSLHKFAREKEFLEQLEAILAVPLVIPVDDIVDLESNAKPVVLKKVLYRAGLDHSDVDSWSGDIDRLLNFRNKIAHGEMKDGICKEDYEKIESSVGRVIDGLVEKISLMVLNDGYLKSPKSPCSEVSAAQA